MAKRPDPIRSAAAKRGWQTRRMGHQGYVVEPCCQPCQSSLFTVNRPIPNLQPTIKVEPTELTAAFGWMAAAAITVFLLWKNRSETEVEKPIHGE